VFSVKIRRLVPIIVFSAFGLSCGLISDAVDQIDDITNEISVPEFNLESDEGSTDDSRAGPDVLNLDDPSLYQYRDKDFTTNTVFEFESAVGSGFVFIDGAWAAGSPPSSTFSFDTTLELFAGFAPVEFSSQGDVLYTYSDLSGCFIEEIDFDDPFDGYYMDDNYLTGEVPLLESGVIVNGMTTDEYLINHENELNKEDSALYDFIATDTIGSVYVDRATGVIVRFKQSGQGLDRSGSSEGVDIRYSLQVDFVLLDNAPTINLPEGCDEGAAEEDIFGGGSEVEIPWPIMDDATNTTGAFGLYGYETEYSIEEVVDFYRVEMAALGFNLESELVAGPTALLEFVSEAGSVVITAGEVETSSGLAVAIVDTTSP
jgi:hypothetical protein